MKNIIEILAGLNITIPQDQLESFNKDFNANYKTIADYDKQTTKLEQVQDTLKTAQEGLKALEGVDVNDLKGQITKLTGDLEAEQTKHAQELFDMSLNSSIEDAIRAAKGKNPKAIMALLDLDALKASKNQEADIKAALDDCQKKNDYLFGEAQLPPPFSGGAGGGNNGGGEKLFNFGFTGIRPHENK